MKEFDLKLFRKSIAKLSQEEFAKKIGFSKGTVGKIEAGHASVSDNILNKIEEIFGTDLTTYKSYSPGRYKKNKSTEEGLISEQEVIHYHHEKLVDLLRDCTEKLELVHKEKEALLLRVSELEKQLLLTKAKN